MVLSHVSLLTRPDALPCQQWLKKFLEHVRIIKNNKEIQNREIQQKQKFLAKQQEIEAEKAEKQFYQSLMDTEDKYQHVLRRS